PALIVAQWPEPKVEWEDAAIEAVVGELREVIGTVRNLRAEYGVQPGQRVALRVSGASAALRDLLAASGRILADLARVEEVTFERVAGEVGASAVLASGTEVVVPLAGVIDIEKERARLGAELDRI